MNTMVEESVKTQLGEVLELYNRSLFARAWECGKSLGEPLEWPGVEGRLLGARLLMNLGGARDGRLQHLRTGRANPGHAEATYYFLYAYMDRRGAFAAWQWRQRVGMVTSGQEKDISDCYGQCSHLLAMLRDFERAEEFLAKAKEHSEADPWFYVQSSYLLETQDRYDDALKEIGRGLEINPAYKPAVQAYARLLELTDNIAASVKYLEERAEVSESPHIWLQLADNYLEAGDYDRAQVAVDRTDETALFKDKYLDSWLHYKRLEIACNRGDYEAGAAHAEGVDERFFKEIAKSIRKYFKDNPGRKPVRKQLPVKFIRQHHLTCVPATLAAISRFWEKPAEHLSIAEEICYDGTPAHSERKWAAMNGFDAREFTVTWENCVALIDRGIPFTLTTTGVMAGHLQAMIGYDEVKHAFLIRDPFIRQTMEMSATRLLEDQAFSGPRGMTMVPMEQADKLAGVQLDDADFYDLLHELNLALEAHDRDEAAAKLKAMQEKDPKHRLTYQARRTLAFYDGNDQEALEAVNGLLELFPKDSGLNLARNALLRELGTRDERLSALAEACADPKSDPHLIVEYVRELAADDRESERSEQWLRRLLRRAPDFVSGIFERGGWLWNQGRKEESLECYRIAACLADMQEGLARAYFGAARAVRKEAEALEHLRRRFERLGARSASPAMSYSDALDLLDRTEDSFAVLDEAMKKRPEDGDLQLFAARRNASYGRSERAAELLEQAKGRVKESDWLTERAFQLRRDGQPQEALKCWEQIVATQELNVTAHSMIASLRSDLSGPSKGVEYVREVRARFPQHWGLCHLWYSWLADLSAAERNDALDALLDLDDTYSWTLREKGLVLFHLGRFEEAQNFLDRAIAADSQNPAGHTLLGQIRRALGMSREAREAFRRAIELSADNSAAIYGLIDLCDNSLEELKGAIAFVEEQMVAQVLEGDGLLTFREVARGVLTPDELLESLKRAHEARPDLWPAWSALSQHLSDMGQHDEALKLAQEATERFPLLPVCWLVLADVHGARLEVDAEIAALTQALELNRDWTQAITRLSGIHERMGDLAAARELLEKAVQRLPGDAILKGSLADIIKRQGEAERAIELVAEAVRIDPEYQWAWQAIQFWSREQGVEDAAMKTAEAMVKERPDEARAWRRLADLRAGAGDHAAALEALDEVLKINPTNLGALDRKAEALAELFRYQEAEEVCRTTDSAGRVPMTLRGREAWIDVMRGAQSEGVAKLEKLLAENPDYEIGWEMMIEWQARLGEYEKAMKAAESLSWLQPKNVVPLGWLGNAKRQTGKRDEAVKVFERALRMEPGYTYAARQLIELHCEKRNHEAARRVVKQISLETETAEIAVFNVMILVAERRFPFALDIFERLSADPETSTDSLRAMANSLIEAGQSAALEKICRQHVKTGRFCEYLVPLWCHFQARRNKLGGYFMYRWLRSLGEPGVRGLCTLLDEMGESEQRVGGTIGARYRLGLIRRMFREWIARDDELWGKLGYVISCRSDYSGVIAHMSDWRRRQGLENWMMHNLALAYLMKGRDEKASEVLIYASDRAAELGGGDSIFRIWCILDACLRNDMERAVAQLHRTPPESIEENYRDFLAYAELVAESLSRPPGRVELTAAQRKVIKAALSYNQHGTCRRLLQRSLMRMGKHIGDNGIWFSGFIRRHSWIWFVLLVPLVVYGIYWLTTLE